MNVNTQTQGADSSQTSKTAKTEKPTADISFEVGFGKDKTRFDLNMISVADEQEIQQKFNDLADEEDDKSEKEYRICLQALDDASSVKDGLALKEKFGVFNIKNERIVRKAYLMFKQALEPESSFL